MKYQRLFIALLPCIGCLQQELPTPDPFPAHQVVLDPQPALAALTGMWAERWSRATGIPIIVKSGGTPIALLPDVRNGMDQECGVTANVRTGADYVTAFVDVSSSPSFAASDGGQLYCPSLAYILGHEFGHVLAPDALHSATGLFSIQASDGIAAAAYIDADSLEAVCKDAPCTAFNVESEPK